MSVTVDSEKCTKCGRCVDICPGDLIDLAPGCPAAMRDEGDCWDCMACVKSCPASAITTKLPYQLADYTATLAAQMGDDEIVWTCTDSDGGTETFTIKTKGF